ncbi:MAG: dUTP diphosphatase, partial [Lactobacillales bacterium]|nr:dUTP diphosphatase [Lactobacillales bacterium]
MTRKRGFEIIKEYKGKGINLPKRTTKHAAGYDFEAACDVEIPSILSTVIKADSNTIKEFTKIQQKEKLI